MPKKGRTWAPEEDQLLGTASDADIARKIGATQPQVKSRRTQLGIPSFTGVSPKKIILPDEAVALLGKASDDNIAIRYGASKSSIQRMRYELGIPAFRDTTLSLKTRSMPWEDVKHLSQPEFFKEISRVWESKFGLPLTYKDLSELTLWSVSRFQKWFTSGSAQQKLQLPVRHHLYVSVAFKTNASRSE
ncbi:hypothetical protein [Chromohalobacter sp. 296-RDG]|uniref:hypothetical protein n=1 Tax=Chromohalobacter sp. 296-RDG TaxID=2994062 RepID=UPI0024694C13|nr:hypothetical protein [Chromohalobacter sp. 296-RDG]